MLESIEDFHYIDVDPVSGIISPDGESFPEPLPKRAGVTVPFDSDPSEFAGDLLVLDPAWLLEACQEREALLLGEDEADDPPDPDPKALSDQLVSVASVLKTWASRWEEDCPANMFLKSDVFSQWSSWTVIGGGTVKWEYKDRWSDQFAVIPAQLESWRDSIPDGEDGETDQQDEFSWAKKARKAFAPYALRDYLSVPVFLGVEDDDDPEENVFAWAGVSEWKGYYPPEVKCLDVLKLFSDLERTVIGAVVVPGHSVSVTTNTHLDSTETTEYSGSYKSHDDCSDGCGTFHQDEAQDPITYNTENDSASTRAVTVSPGTLCAVDDVNVTSVESVAGLLGKCEYECDVERTVRGHTRCHDGDCETTDEAPYDFWTSKLHGKTKYEQEKSTSGQIEFDLSARLENGAEIESAAIVAFAVSVDVTAEKKFNQFLFTHGNAPYINTSYGTNYSGKGQCDFSVSVKLVECEVSDGTVTVPTVDADGLPEASGGSVVELELPSATGSAPQGTQRSPAVVEYEEKYAGKRRSIHAFGPLIVKFKPKTLVEE